MGKMIGVTFDQPWEFEYLGTPIGFDITDWTFFPTRMKADRARSTQDRLRRTNHQRSRQSASAQESAIR
jgi:hypothetical protein